MILEIVGLVVGLVSAFGSVAGGSPYIGLVCMFGAGLWGADLLRRLIHWSVDRAAKRFDVVQGRERERAPKEIR